MKRASVNECILDASVCNNKQRRNHDKCRCECKELIDKGVCNTGYTWNPSNCECECDKSWMLGSIWIMKNVNVEKGWLINLWRNVGEILIKQN